MKSTTHPLGLEDRVVRHPQRGLGFLGVLGVHLPPVVPGLLGGLSFHLVQEAPHPLAVLSNRGHLRQSTVVTVHEDGRLASRRSREKNIHGRLNLYL